MFRYQMNTLILQRASSYNWNVITKIIVITLKTINDIIYIKYRSILNVHNNSGCVIQNEIYR